MQGQSFVLSILYLPLKFKSFYFTTVQKLFFRKFFLEVEKLIMWGSIWVPPNQVCKRFFWTFEGTRVPWKVTEKTE